MRLFRCGEIEWRREGNSLLWLYQRHSKEVPRYWVVAKQDARYTNDGKLSNVVLQATITYVLKRYTDKFLNGSLHIITETFDTTPDDLTEQVLSKIKKLDKDYDEIWRTKGFKFEYPDKPLFEVKYHNFGLIWP